MNRHFLVAGEVYCTLEKGVITTVLGSCVAVCLWDPVSLAGGMNHYVLPRGVDKGSARFGECAIDRLISQMLALGCRLDTLGAKVFGGATSLWARTAGPSVGAQNLAIAMAMLEFYKIPVLAYRSGGSSGMLIHHYTVTGDVLVRLLKP